MTGAGGEPVQVGTSESFSGPDGRTTFVGERLAKKLHREAHKLHPATDVKNEGYGPSSFMLDLEDGLYAIVTVEVRRSGH